MGINGKSSEGKVIIVSLNVPLIIGYCWEKYIKQLERFVEKKKEHPNMAYSEAYDRISAEKNKELYDILTDKLVCKMYSKRPANPVKTIRTGQEKFADLNIFEQAKCLLQIISVFGRNAGGCDLQAVGGKGKEATTRLNSVISNWGKSYSSVRIIDLSPSGLFEKRSENLLSLL